MYKIDRWISVLIGIKLYIYVVTIVHQIYCILQRNFHLNDLLTTFLNHPKVTHSYYPALNGFLTRLLLSYRYINTKTYKNKYWLLFTFSNTMEETNYVYINKRRKIQIIAKTLHRFDSWTCIVVTRQFT